MAAKLTADPDTRIIEITEAPVAGLLSLVVETDIYSDLKEDWLAGATLHPLRFPLSSQGEFKTPATQIGPYVFINNAEGWRILPYDADHELTIIGNLVPNDLTVPLYLSRATRTILVRSEESAQALTVLVDGAGGGLTLSEFLALKDA
ncbi:MAG: hypothetical protein OEO20_11550 [Gemmatimonadota bacterium]|nr:hypothetical protein [Gemmatimonadota bacterium]MDH3367681.1 hypothetical protein [Gemmatimonadota bacterium]MDH3478929.1 hypothetical protein [Gemmatimonadota bacterium]MDH3571295.1 hypothetical protein [Gemmatimonadota bacterium]